MPEPSNDQTDDRSDGRGVVIVTPRDTEDLPLPDGAFGLLADASASGDALGINTLRLGTGADGAQPHYHARSWEVFYVLEGRADFLVDDEIRTVDQGSLVMFPPGLPHAFGAAPGSPTELLVVLTPGVQRFDYFRHLQRAAIASEPPRDLSDEDQDRFDVHFLDRPEWDATRRPVHAAR
jgi:mannose-6-phosphate isomerase-like protein (cupin superfamily)